MKFIDDSTYKLPTVSSVPLVAASTPSPSPSSSDGDTLLSPSLKRKKADEKKELLKGILEALSTPVPTQDGIDGFLLRLGDSLRKLPYRERAKLEIAIMQLVYETEVNVTL